MLDPFKLRGDIADMLGGDIADMVSNNMNASISGYVDCDNHILVREVAYNAQLDYFVRGRALLHRHSLNRDKFIHHETEDQRFHRDDPSPSYGWMIRTLG
ncbi:hypothetical protein CL629_03520 [bacterium]|nr:hypothetical protein [bacterium]